MIAVAAVAEGGVPPARQQAQQGQGWQQQRQQRPGALQRAAAPHLGQRRPWWRAAAC